MKNSEQDNLLWRVAQFIWNEAATLDAREYDSWLDLWNPDGLYIIPIEEAEDYAEVLNLCYDDDKMRRDRIKRFQDGFSISSAPPAITARTVSRFVIDAVDGETVVVSCAQHLVEDKFGRQRLWAANVHYTLTATDSGFMLQKKVVRLLNSDGVLNSFSYLF
ncbi:aromatic-ring-hydroxylating dioxygenase subunit beta [Halomonas halocynthiae]|uniref:aromatic-ring-hydroxylating dioxygenase subunit beta n=1 Tax=Halomonas halocynthiae TaxID=176290 RepID=UPI00040130A1|nr:aromatic-ring-hydroxylating dioxygenase subunit beta [Halomonas halocynthiae]